MTYDAPPGVAPSFAPYKKELNYVEELHESVQGGGDEHFGSAGKRPER
jgi:hypothetical protein